LANLLFLVYIIFVVFYWIYIFINNEVIKINLNFFQININIFISSFFKYLKNYFTNAKNFKNFNIIYNETQKEFLEKNTLLEKELSTKSDFKLNKYLIYIPFINLISIFNYNTKYKIHILNWIIISLLIIISIILNIFYINTLIYLLFLIFPISFWIWYLKENQLVYKPILLYIFLEPLIWLKNKTNSIFAKTKKLHNTEKEVKLKTSN
jgi:hypothetical protein